MGGQAFASGDDPLFTPRMPPDVYQHVLKACHAKLQELFVIVTTPIPAPAKKDYGDVDIVLAWERKATFPASATADILTSPPPSSHNIFQAAAHVLDAKRVIKTQSGVAAIAVPWPSDLPDRIINTEEDCHDDTLKPRYVQVDLHLCHSLEQLQRMLFKHAHGDLFSIVGSIIRPFGLTMDDTALYIRIPEIESYNRKKAKILLTTDPDEILNFLGLTNNRTIWEEPFASIEDLFEYVATCRLFWVWPVQEKENEDENNESDNNNDTNNNLDPTGAEGGEIAKTKLKATERRRVIRRPVFRQWVEEFIPACREAGRFMTQSTTPTRESVRAEAFEQFIGARHAYETRLLDWSKEQQLLTLGREIIKASVPTAPEGEKESVQDLQRRGLTINALKKIIVQEDYSLGICPHTPLKDAAGLYDEDKVRKYVADNWKWIGDVAWEKNQKRLAEKKAPKGPKPSPSGSEKKPKNESNLVKDET
ncbi:hypothetical protein F4819DRAFT_90835 [Hypoxylon fuscum]|nr:hypothetical protein F4819DRAFT_90835 [Hypoxylon fuscum]